MRADWVETGITNNIMVTTGQHKSGKMTGSRLDTNATGSWITKQYGDVRLALDREKELKGGRRSKKIAIIESMNPRWRDLSENWGREMLFKNQRIEEAR